MKPLDEPAIVREFSLYMPRHQALAPGAAAFAEFLTDHLTRHRLDARHQASRFGGNSRALDP
jgi:hypothetical protein